MNLAVATALAGQLTALTLHQHWPDWSELGLDILHPLINVYTNPADPMHAWPGLDGRQSPATAYWIFLAATSIALTDLSISVARVLQGERR